MIEFNELQTLQDAVKIIESKFMLDKEVMTDTEIHDMTETIRGMYWLINGRKHEDYMKQLKDFRDHMDTTLKEYYTGDEDQVDAFYHMDFEVTFNDKKVVLENGAGVFSDIYSCIEKAIDEQY